MPTITLPDGNNLDFPNNVTGKEVAEKISKSLAKDATVIIITHYARILKFLDKLDYVHVFAQGKVLETGDASLADKLEAEGYEWALEKAA